MLESIIDQKVTESDDLPHLSSPQFEIIDRTVTLLKPVHDIMKSISSEKASVSISTPYVRALCKTWENCNDRGGETMRDGMVQSLNRSFGKIESNETLVLATMLNLCFKDKFLVVLLSGMQQSLC